MKFTIQRDGRLTDVELEQSSGYFALDQTAQRALLLTRQLPPLPAQFPETTLTVHLNFSIRALMRRTPLLILAGVTAATAVVAPHRTPHAARSRRPRSSNRDRGDDLDPGDPGTPPQYAVPDFIALSNDADTQAAAKTLGQVLWDDLDFEREFYMIPRDTYASIPAARSIDDVPFDRWRELGADGLVDRHRAEGRRGPEDPGAAVQRAQRGSGCSRASTRARRPTRASSRTPSADEIHKQQRGAATAWRARS